MVRPPVPRVDDDEMTFSARRECRRIITATTSGAGDIRGDIGRVADEHIARGIDGTAVGRRRRNVPLSHRRQRREHPQLDTIRIVDHPTRDARHDIRHGRKGQIEQSLLDVGRIKERHDSRARRRERPAISHLEHGPRNHHRVMPVREAPNTAAQRCRQEVRPNRAARRRLDDRHMRRMLTREHAECRRGSGRRNRLEQEHEWGKSHHHHDAGRATRVTVPITAPGTPAPCHARRRGGARRPVCRAAFSRARVR